MKKLPAASPVSHCLFALALTCFHAPFGAAQNVQIQNRTGSAGQNIPASPRETPAHSITAGPIVLGYVQTDDAHLSAVVGRADSPALGAAVVLPAGTKQTYLPPEQRYVLVESGSGLLSVLPLRQRDSSSDPQAIGGALASPDVVAFSPHGRAAVLYSHQQHIVQVVSGLPKAAAVSATLTADMAEPSLFAISDDADLVVASVGSGNVVYSSSGHAFIPLHLAANPAAWTFLPNSHDLLIADPQLQELARIGQLDTGSPVFSILAQNVVADQLAVSREGTDVVGVSPNSSSVIKVDLASGALQTLPAKTPVTCLVPLRGGFRFLVSAAPTIDIVSLHGQEARR